MFSIQIIKRFDDDTNRLKATANIYVENCAIIRNVRLFEREDGKIFVALPQLEHVNEEGQKEYEDVVYCHSKEGALILMDAAEKALDSEKGFYISNGTAEHPNNQHIDVKVFGPSEINPNPKALIGRVDIGDFTCKRIFIAPNKDKSKLRIDFPEQVYVDKETGDKRYTKVFEFLKEGKQYSKETNKYSEPKDFSIFAYRLLSKEAKKVYPAILPQNEEMER